jgi:hypothetical protein
MSHEKDCLMGQIRKLEGEREQLYRERNEAVFKMLTVWDKLREFEEEVRVQHEGLPSDSVAHHWYQYIEEHLKPMHTILFQIHDDLKCVLVKIPDALDDATASMKRVERALLDGAHAAGADYGDTFLLMKAGGTGDAVQTGCPKWRCETCYGFGVVHYDDDPVDGDVEAFPCPDCSCAEAGGTGGAAHPDQDPK